MVPWWAMPELRSECDLQDNRQDVFRKIHTESGSAPKGGSRCGILVFSVT